MCCFSRPVLSVFATNIFARLSGLGTQYLVYQMQFESEEPNAIILPIPVKNPAAESSIKFIDLSDYGEFFEEVARAFPHLSSGIGCASKSVDSRGMDSLAVHKVGNFVASFVPTVGDFERLDPQFSIPKQTWDKIPIYDDYGFVVFQLEELAGKPHPMAFEFTTRDENVFFPTVHIHDGEVHSVEEFDHNLFLQHASFDSQVDAYRGLDIRDQATKFIRSKDIADKYCYTEKSKGILNPDLLLHRQVLRGTLPNKDTIVKMSGNALVPGMNLRQLQWVWPWVVLAAGIGWFFNRRGRLKKGRTEINSQPEPKIETEDRVH